jgi:formylglycine-generating enzyme required for sulfatase activity
MGGNVAEFVATVIGDHVPAPIDARYRVVRGGGFACPGDLSRTRRRHAYNPRAAHRATGFRLAESPA